MPLPENAVKELLSRGFVRLVANQAGFLLATGELDFGVDLTLRHVEFLGGPGIINCRQSGFAIDVQVKSTCERNVTVDDDALKYDLAVDNYNDLVRRASTTHTIPLVLVLFVLPDDPAHWLSVAASELTLRRCAYIWQPDSSATISANVTTQRISIPMANRVDTSTFERLLTEYSS